jgi:hypothetical protein
LAICNTGTEPIYLWGEILPEGDAHRASVDRMVALIPDLHYAVNRVLEDCTGPDLSKKAGVILWLIGNSNDSDEIGLYLLHKDIVDRVGEWFVLSLQNARSEVSKAKSQLMNGGYISIAGGSKHVHLTDKGAQRIDAIRRIAERTVEQTLAALSPVERTQFVILVEKLVAVTRKPPASELFGPRDQRAARD